MIDAEELCGTIPGGGPQVTPEIVGVERATGENRSGPLYTSNRCLYRFRLFVLLRRVTFFFVAFRFAVAFFVLFRLAVFLLATRFFVAFLAAFFLAVFCFDDFLAAFFDDFFVFLAVAFGLVAALGFLADFGSAADGALECNANIAPCGSMHWAIRSPPGTSIGPFTTRPPNFVTVAAARSALGTIA